ncbi:MAG: hypothetical protein COX39_02020 [Candidatus Nealsonbacteria bacterium CG23_combo_of_CG06-09_8_20_14_all_40_13]|uniref:Transglycosylase SLT domain-containing protein n=1 Tax=Candidatus Nealsonbacteria bacterium CG23_combo_of_CG06-09_8_20_14_all_40_13 TaxID=1974724 RepID=A0A2G9YQU5_9BACT|nr:MAG: hypothetical protein COX39_02020 [Candidatus Nealsonbacteria bacterium CG23_combo_of_CG06-09_8_20_14_all_40_13]PIR71331.1 MAG: hypothetical protein COU44_00130 [Candidatus Nealsonbacteria bacterium CG10_big_fil_rev_8_21_14_0_10_40_24]PIU43077.1 MAG: hypothetical protein COS97_03040 [Candidatus Nealsonbacteria bacterium CG07_land_8_20_14_0_80_40_10]
MFIKNWISSFWTKIKNTWHFDKQQILALSLALKMVGLVFIISLFQIPASAKNVGSAKNSTVSVSLNTKSPNIVEGFKPAKIDIVVGESNFDRVAREHRENAQRQTVRIAYARERASEGAPTEFRAIYKAAGARFNIPWQIIEAVHQVETGKSGSTSKRSYAGAAGPMQFMPGTWRTYGVDGDGNGTADITHITDAIYGAANLLAKSGADEGRINDALFNYNHSQAYVNKVLNVARSIGF